ncbi:MAG: toll/interleukin-1 receptor domain-containing protein [Anaerolineae bacterium]|nr:toll/interleukin-1 receptor domain-containing protein [Anaerolineae bacterium]
MVTIIYHPTDSELAGRIQSDLTQLAGDDQAVIVLISPQVTADAEVQAAIVSAIEQHQRVVPVLVKAAPLPRLIEHLGVVDFTKSYDFEQLAAVLANTPAPLQMKVRTPQTIAANRRTALIVAVFAVLMFLAALYAVGVLGLQAPAAEFAGVETEVVMTRNAYIDAALPHSTEDAANFQPTLDAAATALRPFLVATATAIAGQ